jgi:competence protein ComEC
MDSGKLILFFFCVGNGHCTYVSFPNGQNALIDINTSSGKENPISILKALNINSLDYLIITHPHRDHITGFTELVKKIVIQNFIYSPVYFRPDPVYEDWQTYEYLRTSSHFIRRTIYEHTIGGFLFQGCHIGGVKIRYLLPFWGLSFIQKDINVNDMSLIIRLTYGKNRIIICGDTEETGWMRIPDTLISNTTLLLASHHGNDSGYYLPKISIMAPQYVVISAGIKTKSDADNKYIHQTNKWNHPLVTALLGESPKRVYTTRLSGVIATFNQQSLENIINV